MKGVRCALIILCVVVLLGCAARTRPTSLDPLEKARVYYEQGVSLSREGKFKEALPALKKAVRLYAGYGDAYYNMGIIYHKLGLDEEAIKAYKRATDINPKDVAAHNNLGNVFLRQGQLSAAILELEEAVKIDPTYGLAHHNLALAYYLARMYHRAWDHLNELKLLGISPEADLMDAVDATLNPEEGATKEKK